MWPKASKHLLQLANISCTAVSPKDLEINEEERPGVLLAGRDAWFKIHPHHALVFVSINSRYLTSTTFQPLKRQGMKVSLDD